MKTMKLIEQVSNMMFPYDYNGNPLSQFGKRLFIGLALYFFIGLIIILLIA
jgi:hypothetical protein